jgi:bifunctional UDP-N-acetylglucosamine pyrophosphorylase/glucosamine-1-phosphate N-acetyltransferase
MVARAMQDRLQRALMDDGVTIVDPDNTWIDADVSIGADTTVYPFTFIGAGATIGEGGRIGPFAWVRAGETIGDGAVIGPTALTEAGSS